MNLYFKPQLKWNRQTTMRMTTKEANQKDNNDPQQRRKTIAVHENGDNGHTSSLLS